MRYFTFTIALALLALPIAAQTELNPPEFSPSGAIASEAIKLNLAHDRGFNNPRSYIYYTLDLSDPTPENGTLFVWPITIDTTTIVRAAAFVEGGPAVPHQDPYLHFSSRCHPTIQGKPDRQWMAFLCRRGICGSGPGFEYR